MLPDRFEYDRAGSLDEALQLLARYGEDAKVLAGGQSLIPLLKFRLAAPTRLIDIGRLEGLDQIREEGSTLRIGALARHNQVAASDVVSTRYPTLAATAPMIADPLVRNLGSMGGSLAHADPAGDWGSVMLAVGATMVLGSARGERELPASEFLVDTFTTALEPDELLTEIRIPAPTGATGGTYLKLERKVGDFATVGVAVHVTMDDGHIGRAGIGLTAVGTHNIEPTEAEAALVGAEPTEEAFDEAAHLAATASAPIADVRGSAEYKRHMVEVYVRRGLARSVEMARAA